MFTRRSLSRLLTYMLVVMICQVQAWALVNWMTCSTASTSKKIIAHHVKRLLSSTSSFQEGQHPGVSSVCSRSIVAQTNAALRLIESKKFKNFHWYTIRLLLRSPLVDLRRCAQAYGEVAVISRGVCWRCVVTRCFSFEIMSCSLKRKFSEYVRLSFLGWSSKLLD